MFPVTVSATPSSANEYLLALREQLDVGDGAIIEIDGDDVDFEESA